MADRTPDSEYWKAVAEKVGDECLAFTPEELALYAEGRMPGRQARVIRRHLELCVACRELVADLSREAVPAPAFRFRPAPARGWQIAFATVAAALVVGLVLYRMPPQAQGPALPGPSPSTVAQQPAQPLAPSTAPTAPQAPAVTPPAPETQPSSATRPSAERQPARRQHRHPATQPRQMLAEGKPKVNDVQVPTSLALLEPGKVTVPSTEDPLALDRAGLSNPLDARALPPLPQSVTAPGGGRP